MRALVATVLVVCGCSPGAFACDDTEDCADGDRLGACQPDGFCSFPDGECSSGQRYGSHAGDLSGLCVMPFGDTESSTSSASSPTTMPTITVDPTGLEDSTVSLSSTDASDDDGIVTADDTTIGMTSTPGSTDDGVSDESSTGVTPTGPELALWLELEDASFSAGIADSGPFDLMAACGSDDACPTAVPGFAGQGAEFHGSGECILVPHDAAFTDLAGLTVSAWVQLAEPGGLTNRMLASKAYGAENYNTFELYHYDVTASDDLLQARFAAVDVADVGQTTAPRQTPTGVWSHIAGTWDGATVALWLDGAQVSTAPLGGLAIDEHDVRIGCDEDPGGDPFDNVFVGVVDDIRIYREALDAEQIAALAAGNEP